ncbi:hypothetical protein [Halomarina rubra]|uniref:Helix-turn-helix domain-containing protein n=1 Tax=Halomarina rubra TaxID=2071873 RepID=A0ABD6AT10_9EURY|nr:hypothetical protein [Halomarina rubra]
MRDGIHIHRDEATLRYLYWERECTLAETAAHCGTDSEVVRRAMERLGIDRRPGCGPHGPISVAECEEMRRLREQGMRNAAIARTLRRNRSRVAVHVNGRCHHREEAPTCPLCGDDVGVQLAHHLPDCDHAGGPAEWPEVEG